MIPVKYSRISGGGRYVGDVESLYSRCLCITYGVHVCVALVGRVCVSLTVEGMWVMYNNLQ